MTHRRPDEPFNGEWYDDKSFWFPQDSLPVRPRRVVPGVFGNGRLACSKDLDPLLTVPSAEAGLSLSEVTLLVETSTDGTTLEPLMNRQLHLPPDLLERHVLVAGTTGAGKTMKVLLPLLAAAVRDPRRTVLAVDAKGGVLFDFVRHLARRHRPGQRVEQVNLKDVERATIHWNPANRLRNRGDALLIAHSVVTNAETGVQGGGGGANELFWVNSSINLLADILLALHDDPKETASLARAKEIVDKDAYALAVFADKHPSKDSFSKKYPAIVRVMEGRDHVTQQCVLADLAMRLQLLGDENIAANTSGAGGLDLASVLRTGGMLILEVPEGHSRQLVPLTNLFVGQLFSALMDEAMRSPGGRLARPCTVVLDEFGSAVGKLADFDCRLSTLRSRGVSVVAAVQTLSQIESLYGKGAGAILEGFCSKLFFGGGLAQADARYASELSGVCTVECVTVTETNEVGIEENVLRSHTRVPTARAVLLPEEVARPQTHSLLGAPVTAFLPNLPPFQAYLTPAYEQGELSAALRAGTDSTSPRDYPAERETALGADRLPASLQPAWQQIRRRFDSDRLGKLLDELEALREVHEQLPEPRSSLLELFVKAVSESGTRDMAATLSFLHWRLVVQIEGRSQGGPDDPARAA